MFLEEDSSQLRFLVNANNVAAAGSEKRSLRQSITKMENGIRIIIHAVPNARETRILTEPDGSLMMRVHAPPIKGKANREIVKWLSKKLGKPSSQVRIVAGLGSNLKTVEIIGMDESSFLEAIAQERAANA